VSYEGAPADGSAWIVGGMRSRVARGGGWLDSGGPCRSAYRGRRYDAGGYRSGYADLGFRPAMTPSR
jgi:formylglycine-generating enzyme required for sulfatase activity